MTPSNASSVIGNTNKRGHKVSASFDMQDGKNEKPLLAWPSKKGRINNWPIKSNEAITKLPS